MSSSSVRWRILTCLGITDSLSGDPLIHLTVHSMSGVARQASHILNLTGKKRALGVSRQRKMPDKENYTFEKSEGPRWQAHVVSAFALARYTGCNGIWSRPAKMVDGVTKGKIRSETGK